MLQVILESSAADWAGLKGSSEAFGSLATALEKESKVRGIDFDFHLRSENQVLKDRN